MKNTHKEFLLLIRDVVIIFAVVFGIIKPFIIAPFLIKGHSMESSFHDAEFVLVNKWRYLNLDIAGVKLHNGDPKRGDVVVLEPHVNGRPTYYIKRVIGLPGDTIRISSGTVYVSASGSDKEIMLDEEAYLNEYNNGQTRLPPNVETESFVVPADSYWVMGDNRTNSTDSRSCFSNCSAGGHSHFVGRDDIKGIPVLSLGGLKLSFSEERTLPKISESLPMRGTNIPNSYEYPELP